ncbi:hypothetical protein EDD73_15110 [Heliophilum fasciatum]|uniref:Uncharacterized protein n=1 Tax=Heliophilum fasciatum TaxID=35700 RepID=A0A4R2R912_9FIRM|nr:hypothetical protein EDD73_15110 [Heliophilum fasciatum]
MMTFLFVAIFAFIAFAFIIKRGVRSGHGSGVVDFHLDSDGDDGNDDNGWDFGGSDDGFGGDCGGGDGGGGD